MLRCVYVEFERMREIQRESDRKGGWRVDYD